MAPNGVMESLKSPDYPEDDANKKKREDVTSSSRQPLKWINIISITVIHILGIWGAILAPYATIPSVIFCTVWGVLGGFGVTAGAHRLWAHRTYQAKLPLRIFLAACFSISGQNTIPQWVQDHRVHHKFSETDADPHNSKRGFFFAHVGWLMQKKHPQVLSKGKLIDMSDLYADPVVRFHTKYFIELKILLAFLLPMIIPYYLWGESFNICFYGNMMRLIIGLNVTWLVNSAAHIYGYRPYSSQIRPAENKLVSFLTLGEGWHNYHHVFPWDYKAAELGGFVYNPTTLALEQLAVLGQVTHLKSASTQLIEKVARKYGDGSHISVDHQHLVEVDEEGREVICDEEKKS